MRIVTARCSHVQEVHFADIQLDKEAGDAGTVRGGWACLEFRSAREAALTYPEYVVITSARQML